MYYTFDNTHIVTGYIKELLKTFNLPMAKIYDETKTLRDGKYYIKNNSLYYCNTDLELVKIGPYAYNKKTPNLTRNLIINSSTYDSYTHTYLGDYLRFIRDYKHLNLMPLYNCFSNERATGLDITGTISSINPNYIEGLENKYVINTDDTLYKYYLVPVKFDETYTIAIDSDVPYDICCMIYTGDIVIDIAKTLISNTITHIQGSSFTKPFTFETTMPSDATVGYVTKNSKRYQDYENNLRLLIKLPKKVNSSIVVLEGNYTGSSTSYMNQIAATVIYSEEISLNDLLPAGSLSLLSVNNGESYPFADRLVEYLILNAVTHLDFITNNVSRVQNEIYSGHTFRGYYDIWDSNINLSINDLLNEELVTSISDSLVPNFANIYIIKDVFQGDVDSEGYPDYITYKTQVYKNLRFSDTNKDLLTYLDKDVEYYLENK